MLLFVFFKHNLCGFTFIYYTKNIFWWDYFSFKFILNIWQLLSFVVRYNGSVLFSSLEPLTKLSVITCTVNKWKMIFLHNQAFQRYLYSWSQKLLLWDFGFCSIMWPYRCAHNKGCLVDILSEWVIHSAIPPPIFFLLKNENGREEEVAMMTRNSVYQFKWKIYNLLKILMINSTISTTYTEF